MTIKEFNLKWLEYMNSVDIKTVKKCPNGHKLISYLSAKDTETVIITCPEGGIGTGVPICEYFDYNTFSVSKDVELAID